MIGHTAQRPRQWLVSAQLLLWRHGWWGPLAAVALLLSAATWQWDVRPTARRIDDVDAALRAPRQASAPRSAALGDTPERQALTSFRAALQPYREHAQIVRRIVAVTGPDLQWTQAEFQSSRDSGLGLVRLQISAPVTGDYRRLRRGLERALREVPGLSLDQVSFRRELGTQAQLESRVKLSLWLLAPEGREPIDGEAGEVPR